jgi:hypothetical protein
MMDVSGRRRLLETIHKQATSPLVFYNDEEGESAKDDGVEKHVEVDETNPEQSLVVAPKKLDLDDGSSEGDAQFKRGDAQELIKEIVQSDGEEHGQDADVEAILANGNTEVDILKPIPVGSNVINDLMQRIQEKDATIQSLELSLNHHKEKMGILGKELTIMKNARNSTLDELLLEIELKTKTIKNLEFELRNREKFIETLKEEHNTYVDKYKLGVKENEKFYKERINLMEASLNSKIQVLEADKEYLLNQAKELGKNEVDTRKLVLSLRKELDQLSTSRKNVIDELMLDIEIKNRQVIDLQQLNHDLSLELDNSRILEVNTSQISDELEKTKKLLEEKNNEIIELKKINSNYSSPLSFSDVKNNEADLEEKLFTSPTDLNDLLQKNFSSPAKNNVAPEISQDLEFADSISSKLSEANEKIEELENFIDELIHNKDGYMNEIESMFNTTVESNDANLPPTTFKIENHDKESEPLNGKKLESIRSPYKIRSLANKNSTNFAYLVNNSPKTYYISTFFFYFILYIILMTILM